MTDLDQEQIAPAEQVNAAPVLYKFTNQAHSPELDDILAMFYIGVGGNTLGIMQAFNLVEEREELILVGVQLDEEGKADCYPLAKVLRAEDVRNYLAPNGKGGFYDPMDPTDSAIAKEDMRSYDEAVVDCEEVPAALQEQMEPLPLIQN